MLKCALLWLYSRCQMAPLISHRWCSTAWSWTALTRPTHYHASPQNWRQLMRRLLSLVQKLVMSKSRSRHHRRSYCVPRSWILSCRETSARCVVFFVAAAQYARCFALWWPWNSETVFYGQHQRCGVIFCGNLTTTLSARLENLGLRLWLCPKKPRLQL